jgi:hypothetical protein
VYREAKRGRPEHVRTRRNASLAALLFAMGRDVAEVAKALGITQPTLRKHYFSEVQQRDVMLLKLEGDVLLKLFEAAETGNVGAMKELMARADKAGLQLLAGSVTKRGKKAEPKAKPVGKKEEQAAAAKGVGGRFGTREPPPLLVN